MNLEYPIGFCTGIAIVIFSRNVWVLCMYEGCFGVEHEAPERYQVLGVNLIDALYKASQIFPIMEYRIRLRNINRPHVQAIDFDIIRECDNNIIGEIEYWPKGYEPEPLCEDINAK